MRHSFEYIFKSLSLYKLLDVGVCRMASITALVICAIRPNDEDDYDQPANGGEVIIFKIRLDNIFMGSMC